MIFLIVGLSELLHFFGFSLVLDPVAEVATVSTGFP